jgi:hypothetical protein
MLRRGATEGSIPFSVMATIRFTFHLKQLVGDWGAFLSEAGNEDGIMLLKRHERTGRPLGSQRFVVGLEKSLGRRLLRQPPGPKRKNGIRNERG